MESPPLMRLKARTTLGRMRAKSSMLYRKREEGERKDLCQFFADWYRAAIAMGGDALQEFIDDGGDIGKSCCRSCFDMISQDARNYILMT